MIIKGYRYVIKRPLVSWFFYAPKDINTENSVFRASSLKGTKISFGSVWLVWPWWSGTTIILCDSPGEKKMGPNQLFFIWCIWSWLLWLSVKILMSFFGFCKIQVADPHSRDLWCDQHWHISCCNNWKNRDKGSFVHFLISLYNED